LPLIVSVTLHLFYRKLDIITYINILSPRWEWGEDGILKGGKWYFTGFGMGGHKKLYEKDEHRTSNVQHRTSNAEEKMIEKSSRGRTKCWVLGFCLLFNVGRSMFDVGRSRLWDLGAEQKVSGDTGYH
jgi:hypothetical protein